MITELSDQILAQVAGGHERFHPWVVQGTKLDIAPALPGNVTLVNPIQGHLAQPTWGAFDDSHSFFEAVSGCHKCALANPRLGVCVKAPLVSADVFVLAEAPVPLSESAFFEGKKNLFEGQDFPDAVLSRLLARLPTNLKVHRSYALKCVPRKGPSLAEREVCAQNWLQTELNIVNPKVVFVFGALAENALRGIRSPAGEVAGFSACPVLVFPSSEQLEAHVGWRAAVWNQIQQALAPS